MSQQLQNTIETAWENRANLSPASAPKEVVDAVEQVLAGVMDVALPDAGFYLWAKVPDALSMTDAEFAKALLAQYNVTVLPGSYLAREAQGSTVTLY